MLVLDDIKYSYNDICIAPSVISSISSRKECNPFDENGYLPIFTAPMTNVVDLDAATLFEANKIYSILPRSINFETRMDYARQTKRWIAISLREFQDNFMEFKEENSDIKILIDIANGHMQELYELVHTCKSVFANRITIMIGNIANPETYHAAVRCGVDFIRCSVGTGSACITSSNTAIHYPIVSLLDEIRKIKNDYIESGKIAKDKLPKIVADGGIRNYSDVIKALAVGADYVMIGGVLGGLFGSAGDIVKGSVSDGVITIDYDTNITQKNTIYNDGKFFYNGMETDLYKKFYGMASRKGQKDFNSQQKKTSEGLEKWIPITHTIEGWVENMEAYLRSAMSYTNSRVLSKLYDAKVIIVSQGTVNAVNK